MPISNKIITEIEKNKEWTQEFKDLLLELLVTEENNYQYTKKFDKLVSDYMKNQNLEDENND